MTHVTESHLLNFNWFIGFLGHCNEYRKYIKMLVHYIVPQLVTFEQLLSALRRSLQLKKLKSALLTGVLGCSIFGGINYRRHAGCFCLAYLVASAPDSGTFPGALRNWFLRSFWRAGEDNQVDSHLSKSVLGPGQPSSINSPLSTLISDQISAVAGVAVDQLSAVTGVNSGGTNTSGGPLGALPPPENRREHFALLWEQNRAEKWEQKRLLERMMESTMGGLRSGARAVTDAVAEGVNVHFTSALPTPPPAVTETGTALAGALSEQLVKTLPDGERLLNALPTVVPPAFMSASLQSTDSQVLPSPLELLDRVQSYDAVILDFLLFKVAFKWRRNFRAIFVGFLERWFLLGRPVSSNGVCTLVDVDTNTNAVLVQLIDEVEKHRATEKKKRWGEQRI